MVKNKGFSFYENFWTSIESLPLEQQKNVCYAIAKYGITGEIDDDPLASAMTQAFKISIDNSAERFNTNNENGRAGGRPIKASDEEIKQFLIQYPTSTSAQVASYFGMSASAIQKRDIWKKRKEFIEDSVEKVINDKQIDSKLDKVVFDF